MYISKPINLDSHTWYFRISEGEYEWTIALEASYEDSDLHDAVNPFTIYAFRVEVRDVEWIGYIVAVYPRGCAESACALYFHTEFTDEDIAEALTEIAKLVHQLYDDPELFIENLREMDMRLLSPEEADIYQLIKPDPETAKRIADTIEKVMGIDVWKV